MGDFATIAELARLFQSRELSPVEYASSLLQKIEKSQSKLHSFITITPEVALERARKAESLFMRGGETTQMTGIPYGLKDIICTMGIATTGHSKIFENFIPTKDAFVEARLKHAGAVLLGKLATFELAHGGPSWDLPWPPAMNPWKEGYLPGNTSSGAGSAVSAGLLPAAVGSDTGGSIRMPAAVCGIVGVKPTYGLVSRSGVLPNTFTFDTCGPMTRTVEDAAIMLQSFADYDDDDLAANDHSRPDFSGELGEGLSGIKIGWVRHWYAQDDNCHEDVPGAVDEAIDVLRHGGAEVEEIELSSLQTYQDCKTTISITEMFSAYESKFRSRPQHFGKMYRNKVLSGALIRAEDYFQATRQRLWLCRELARAFREFDILATAGWLTVADPANPGKDEAFLRPPNITTPFNIGGQPAMTIPCGFSRDGLPLSLQLAARNFAEPTLFRVGHEFQRLTNWHSFHPKLEVQ